MGSHLLPILNCCTYHGPMEPSIWFNPHLDAQSNSYIESFWSDFDWNTYKKHTLNLFKPLIIKWAEKIQNNFFPITVTNFIFHQPRQYNYGTDHIYFNILIEDADWIKWALDNKDKIKWQCNHFGYEREPSYVNAMPHNWSEFYEYLGTNKKFALATVLLYLSENEFDGYIKLSDRPEEVEHFHRNIIGMMP